MEVRLELYGANARLVVSPPSLSPPDANAKPMVSSHFPAPLAKFQLVWHRLCEALLSSSSLAGQKYPSLLSHLCLKCRRYKGRFALNMKISLLHLRTESMRSQRRLQFGHGHRRRADRAPQIPASFTRDRRRAHRHVQWGKLGPDQIGGEMVARAACTSRPEGSPWTCLLYTSPSPRDQRGSRMPSSA